MTKTISLKTEQLLKQWADEYHTPAFILSDPVQFPHHYTRKQDIEISGLLTALLSFGNRKMICKKCHELDGMMGHDPYQYVRSEKWRTDFPDTDTDSFYRTCSYARMHVYFERLWQTYRQYTDLEERLKQEKGSPMQRICSWMEVSEKGPQKKLNMFLRWMIRRNSPVDFGIWQTFDPAELIIPLDTHVNRMAYELGLTSSMSYTLNNARKITEALGNIFPNDPCKGDFALFGYSIEKASGQGSESGQTILTSDRHHNKPVQTGTFPEPT